jgi:hypothetical protein
MKAIVMPTRVKLALDIRYVKREAHSAVISVEQLVSGP